MKTSIVNVIAAVVCIVIIVVVIMTSIVPRGRPMRNARLLKDQAMMREIHRSMLVYAESNKGILPRPGLLNRLTDAETGLEVPGAGPENTRKNTTRHLYSMMVALVYFDCDILIGASERNPRITECETYDDEAYQPLADVYWDGDDATNGAGGRGNFMTTLDGTSDEPCHASFAHQALFRKRAKTIWVAEASPTAVLLSTRMPWRRAVSGPEFDDSYTLLLHGEDDQWIGAAVFGDNHAEVFGTVPQGPAEVGMTKSIEDDVLTQYHEELIDR